MTNKMTYGQRYKIDHPDWKHECCKPGNCNFRDWEDTEFCICKQPSPWNCNFFVSQEVCNEDTDD